MRGRTGNLRIWDLTIVTPSLLRDVAGARRAITPYTRGEAYVPATGRLTSKKRTRGSLGCPDFVTS